MTLIVWQWWAGSPGPVKLLREIGLFESPEALFLSFSFTSPDDLFFVFAMTLKSDTARIVKILLFKSLCSNAPPPRYTSPAVLMDTDVL